MFVNALANMSEHDDLLVKDELVVQNLKIPSNGTVTGLTISHIDGLSSAVGGNVDEQAILASLQGTIDLKADITSIYTQTEIDGFLATKPNSTDVYTKTQIDSTISGLATTATVNSQLQDKADSSTVYTQTQANTLLNAKADSADVYLKTEVDSAIAGFATTTELQNKAETSAVYDRGTIDTKLSDKANSSDVYLKTEVDSAISGFATTASVTSQLQNKAETSAVYDRGTIDTYLLDKANSADVYLKTEVDSSLALKVNSTDLTTQLAQKASVSALNLKANQTALDSTNTNLTNLTTQVNSQAAQDAPFVQIPQVYTSLGLNANGNGEAFYHNGHRLAAQSFLVGKDKFQETQPEDSYFRYIGYIDLLNDYTQGSYDFNDPYGEIRFRNNCKIRMKDNSVETLVPFTQTSDGRAKTNKEGIRSGLDAVLRLKPQTYEKNGKTESGFITQEVLEIPELKHLVDVPENKDEYQSLNYIGIIAHLVSAIQELNNKLK